MTPRFMARRRAAHRQGTKVPDGTYMRSVGEVCVQAELLVILVVEDEALLQDMVQEALVEGGFEAEMASSGEQAITILEGNKGKHRAVITDINLRGRLTGWDVAKRARELDPAIPVIYMTGDAADQWASLGVPNSLLLNKPFAPAQIVTAVAQLLNTTPPAAPH
jgi:CheY-like chemotaxis protein